MKKLICLMLLLSIVTLTGCVTKTFYIKDLTASSINYSQKSAEGSLSLIDARDKADKKFSIGTLRVVLKNMENEILYLGDNLEKLLKNRGVILTYDQNGSSELKLDIHKFRIRNHRASGFSPYFTFTTFSADLMDKGQSTRITAYFKNGKVPVWAFREVEEPCYNIPVDLVIKEIASKINQAKYGLVSNDQVVENLANDIKTNFNADSYFKVLELGYTNNPAAIPYLVEFVGHNDTMISSCALSSLGMLKAKDHLDLLKDNYKNKKNTQKFMALKAIGDLQTEESKKFIEDVKNSNDYKDKMLKEIVDLYIM